ncbi:DUF5713 family protein [Lysobacter sp. Root690]|uniref:DUF5713 family protein n=1 Tax=Lysobacter sp. Root690 TaxID=1736588 RepID=UPI0006F6DE65|nr:DUF5713 family protein [Lysobacter sp. Root690]KRB08653.1 hypothetical protein ASD86_04825 [Lysobacter sp. Root690]
MPIANEQLQAHRFLSEMQHDSYFPADLVQKGQQILIRLCETIEAQRPDSLDALYALTHAATDEFNALAGEFEANDSEIETAARENIGADFRIIAAAYGFQADSEELIATRDW